MVLHNDFPLDCYRKLAAEVIELACRDHIRTLKNCRKAASKEQRKAWGKLRIVEEEWFRGECFGRLNYANLDPEYIIEQCRRVAKYPKGGGG